MQEGCRDMLLEESVKAAVRRTATPMIIALLMIGSVGAVDALFVSRLGPSHLAALGFAVPAFYLTVAVWIGFSVGATSLIARYLGAGEHVVARRVALESLLVAVPLLALLMPALVALEPAMSQMLGVPAEARGEVATFCKVIALGMPATALVVLASAILRAHGEGRASGALIVLASLGNIVLDPLLIGGVGSFPGYGVPGAAMAAVGGYLVAAIPSVTALVRRGLVGVRCTVDSNVGERLSMLLTVSLPAMFAQLLKPTALLGLTALLSSLGEEAVAAFATGSNLERVFGCMCLGLASAMAPIVSQSWGARAYARASECIRLCARWVVVGGGVTWILAVLSSRAIAEAFLAKDALATSHLLWLLWILPLGYGATAVTQLAVSALNACGRSGPALLLNVLEQWLVGLPAAAAGGYWGGVPGLFFGWVIAQALVAFAAWRALVRVGLLVQPGSLQPMVSSPVGLGEAQ